MKFKRFRLLCACAICCALFLTACQGKTPVGSESSSDVTDTQISEAASNENTDGASEDASSDATVTDAPAQDAEGQQTAEFIDFAGELKLDMSSDTLKQEVTVKTFVDGDTTHFYVPTSISEDGVLKARYIAINTPESTGKIEEYGKSASNFTKTVLSGASSIIIESDDSNWNIDSTGGRYLVWVWYRNSENEDYRNLNLEILQNGLAIASSSANNRYGETCVAAIANAKACKLNIYSGEKDPNFFYGDAIELTLKELRTHLEEYNGCKVAFEGVITRNYNNGVYIEEYDEETNLYYGIMVYYGFGLNGEGIDILSVGNRSRIVGSLQFYETGGTYQVSGLTYRQMKPNDPGNIQKISDGNEAAYAPVSADDFANAAVTITVDEELKVYRLAELIMGTTVSMSELKVTGIYTTSNEDSSSYGAMTMTCESADGNIITVRTIPLYGQDNEMITADAYMGKVIDVRGIVDYFDGSYQIKVLSDADITIK